MFQLLLFLAVSFFAAGTAMAHKVMVFAWVEGDTVYTESKFSGGKKVNKGRIIVYDQQENRLLEGETNEKGEFSFKVPEKTTLKIVLQAGMGHRADWTLPIEESESVASRQMEAPSPAVADAEKPQHQVQPISQINAEDIQSAIEKALHKELKPLYKMLAESRNQGPSVTEIFGGIGYIIGLIGLAAYFKYRRKN
ncbi:MAG: hypothetical protein JRI32_11230 [Deltaproteobacteria bacterium]|nr:hypothetical protein [Deltaproteobacteria bacterium]